MKEVIIKMADRIMKTITIGGNAYEIYDEAARNSIERLKAETIVYDAGDGLNLTNTSSTNLTFSLDNSGVTPDSYGLFEDASPSHGETFSVPCITVDSYGRVTSASTNEVTLPTIPYGDSTEDLGVSSAGSATTVSRSDHVHALPELNSCSGVLDFEKGGTGGTTVAELKENLGLTAVVTSGNSYNYYVTVQGIDSLTVGTSLIIIPHVTSDSIFLTLDVNNLGAKYIRRRTSDYNSGGVALPNANYLQEGCPTRVIYNGTYWIVEDTICPVKSDYVNILLDTIYPVGSIYMSVNNISPQTFLGGTWEQIKDTFLLSAGDTYAAGSTGGADIKTGTYDGIAYSIRKDNYVYTKNITIEDEEYVEGEENRGEGYWIPTAKYSEDYTKYSKVEDETETFKTGVLTSTNIKMDVMPPYLTVYMWCRIS